MFPGSTIGGCITDLPSFRKLDATKRTIGKVRYDSSDNKAWSMWRKRHVGNPLSKDEWYNDIRQFSKKGNLEHLRHWG